jgi:hypothetical protein
MKLLAATTSNARFNIEYIRYSCISLVKLHVCYFSHHISYYYCMKRYRMSLYLNTSANHNHLTYRIEWMNIIINLILRIHIPNDRGVRIRIIISSTSSRIVRESNNSWEWIRESLCKWLVETDPHIPHCCNCYIYIAIRLDSFLDRKKVSSVSSWDCLSTSKRGCSGGRNMDTLGPWQSTKILFAQPFQLDSILTERSKLAVFFL